MIGAARRRAREERGFTMVTVMAVMLCVTLLSIAALAAAQGDLKPGAHDRARKVAYAAAEAGVQNYLFHLSQDPNYWTKCASGAPPHAVNDAWDGVLPDPRNWTTLDGAAARYSIELLPANGSAACSVADPAATMIDAGSGTFKVRATGQDLAEGVKRSIVATFKRRSFLDYLYFTDKETRAPGLYGMSVRGRVTRERTGTGRDLETWAKDECDRYWGNDPSLGSRHVPRYDGEYQRPSDNAWIDLPNFSCNEPEFKKGDVIAGPLHSNDEIQVECDSPMPRFGDSIDDVVETSSLGQTVVSPANPRGGWRDCATQDPFVNFADTSPAIAAGTWKPRAAPMQMPLTNTSIKRDTAPAYRFEGTTRIELNGTTMRVTGTREDGTALTNAVVAIPDDGAVYVSTDGSCTEYTPVDSGAGEEECGNLELEGDYAADVTFAAENDILLTDGVTRTSPSSQHLLGLIATNFIRVHHPVIGCDPDLPVTCNYIQGCTNGAGSPTNVVIEGAILSLTKSFIADNWFCGGPLGTLRVYGAIAQKYRGPVLRENFGELSGTSGYVKSYSYDTKLKYRSPPLFLDPVGAQWRVQTFSEQVPAR